MEKSKTFITALPNFRLYVIMRMVDAGFEQAARHGQIPRIAYITFMESTLQQVVPRMLSADTRSVDQVARALADVLEPTDSCTDPFEFVTENLDALEHTYIRDYKSFYMHILSATTTITN
jgi:hypothetical protein